MNDRKLHLLIWLALLPSLLHSQITYTLQSEAQTGNGDNAPFWLTSNRQGLGTTQTDNAYLRTGIAKIKNEKRDFDYSFGVDLVKTYRYPASFIIQQAYLDLKFKKIALSLGSKERTDILKNSALSSGGMAWSGNSRPIPQVYFGTNDYITFPWLLKKQLKVKGGTSFGWYTDNEFQKDFAGAKSSYNQNIHFHHKGLALRYEFNGFPWKLDVGLEQNTQFGSKYYEYNIYNFYWIYDQKVMLKDYLKTLIPSQGDQSNTPGDQVYMYGNTTGNWQIKLTYGQNGHNISGYLDNYFDDFSGMAKQNRLDGLWGLEYRKDKKVGITGIVLEYLQTTNQGGPFHWATHDYTHTNITDEATGKDNYYNNYFYAEGWSHFGMNNGNPLLTSPIYNKDGSLTHFNNRVKAVHLGISGTLNKAWDGRILTSYSKNYGTHDIPYINIRNSLSSLIEINYHPQKLTGWSFTLSGAHDRSDVIGNNEALSFKISKTGMMSR